MSKDRTIELSAPQILGGALAAASAAVASSWLGVAGTVLGAVLVSVIATVGTAVYSSSLERSSRALRDTLPIERGAGRVLRRRLTGATPAPASKPTLRRRWRALLATAGVTCLLALAVLTGFEALMGKPASTLTGSGGGTGTTVSRLVSDESDAGQDRSPAPRADPAATPSTSEPSQGDPSPRPTAARSAPPSSATPTVPTTAVPTGPAPTGATSAPEPSESSSRTSATPAR